MAESEAVPHGAENDRNAATASAAKAIWQRPVITSSLPVSDSEGISFRPLDGVNNLS